MSKIARPALLNGAQFYIKNWREVLALAIKTAFLIITADFILAGLIDAASGTDLISLVKREIGWGASFNFFAFLSLPPMFPQQSLYAKITSTIISVTTYSWFISPLIVSLSRSIISGEKFDGTLFSRLTEARCLKIALVLWVIGFVMSSFGFLPDPELTPTWLDVVTLVLFFLASYIIFRLDYLLPIFALDRQFSTSIQTWRATRGKAWSMFKVLFFIVMLFSLSMFLFTFLIRQLGFILSHTGQVITVEIISATVWALIVEPVFIGGVASAYKILEHQQK